MLRNDSVTGAENIVQLPHARRAGPTLPRLQPSPLVPFASWAECRDKAAAALLGGTKRMLLTGPAGTGKTVLIDHVARVLRAAGRTVIVQLADADPAAPAAGVTLFVDEANRLSAAKLRNLQEAEGTVVLAGLGTLAPPRIPAGTVHLALAPLGQEAVRDYIVQWLTLTGRTPADLDSSAVRRLVELSGGIPRLLSTLLAAASWLAETSGAATITAAHVQEAADLRSVLVPATTPEAKPVAVRAPKRRGRAVWSTLLASGVVLVAAAAIAPRLFPAETDRLYERAAALTGTAERWTRAQLSGTPTPQSARPARTGPSVPTPAPPVAAVPEPTPPDPPSAVAPPIAAPPTAAPPTAVPQIAAPPVVAPPIVVIEPPVPPAQEPEPTQAAAEPAAPPPMPAPVPVPAPATASATASTPASAPVPAAVQPKLSAEMVDFLIRRGREMRDLHDYSAARLLFRRAADDGNAEAMFDLGASYDPVNLDPIGEHAQANLPEAMRWYRRAAEAGSGAATRQFLRK